MGSAVPAITRLILVPSPLTGPYLWSAVCDELWARGQRTAVARLTDTSYIYPPFWLSQAASVAAGLPEEDDIVLAAHSGAGVLLPAIGRFCRNRGCEARIAGYLFVDCDLPRDGCSRLDLFDDPAAAQSLRERSKGGWMPRWDETRLAPLIPDTALRREFVARLPRVPIDLYEEPLRVPEDWPDAPCGYLQLSEHYPSAVRQARESGWALEHLDAHHLAPLTEPGAVAEALLALLEELAGRRSAG